MIANLELNFYGTVPANRNLASQRMECVSKTTRPKSAYISTHSYIYSYIYCSSDPQNHQNNWSWIMLSKAAPVSLGYKVNYFLSTYVNRSQWDSGRDEAVEVDQRGLIEKILARYPGQFTVFRELLQNSDDAKSSGVEIRFETKDYLDAENVASSEQGLDLENTTVSTMC